MRTFHQRFWSKVRKTEMCWIWTGYVASNGYGQITIQKIRYSTHRLSYETEVGPIPEGLHIDHLCRTKRCVRPSHLEPVTCRENVLRGMGLAAKNARKKRCKRGHPFEGKNFYVNANGQRICLPCKRIARRAYRKKYPGRR